MMIKKEYLGWSVFNSYYRLSRSRLAIIIWIIDQIGNLLFILRKKNLKKDPESILIIQLDHIGDMILNSSLIQSLRLSYPQAKITVLIRSLARPVAEMISGIDDILILHTPWLSRERNVGWIGVIKFCLKHFKSFDMVFEVHGEIRNNFLAWMLGRFRVGTSVRGGGFFLNKAIIWEREYNLHICGMQTRMLDMVTGKINKVQLPQITIPQSAKTVVFNLLKENSIASYGYVFIQISTGGKNREWPLENWKKFIEHIISSGRHVVCADLDSEKISAIDPGSPLFHKVDVSLPEYAELVRNAKVVVTVDTFCGHIASCFEVPALSIYSGAIIWDEWRPVCNKIEYIQDRTCPKYPCGQLKCIYGYYSPCMKKIAPEIVISSLDRLIKNL